MSDAYWLEVADKDCAQYREALERIANWDFGRYSPSADEEEMVQVAREALGL